MTHDMIDEIAELGYEPLECVLEDMPRQILANDKTGVVENVFDKVRFPNRPERQRAINCYYATPDLHKKAARNLNQHFLNDVTPDADLPQATSLTDIRPRQRWPRIYPLRFRPRSS